MESRARKFVVLATVLMLAIAPAAADEHLNETEDDSDKPENDSDTEEENETENETVDDSDIDGTDNSTELLIDESQAEETARNALSDNNWTLEDSSTEEEEGYYKFEFIIEGEEAEAEVRVDGSSGEIFRHEEELEKESGKPEVEKLEQVEVQNLEQARERIKELRKMVMDLRRQVAKLEAEQSGEREAEVEVKRGQDGETKVEAEKETSQGESEVEAEGQVNGTPGSETARENRPGFVNQLLSGFFR